MNVGSELKINTQFINLTRSVDSVWTSNIWFRIKFEVEISITAEANKKKRQKCIGNIALKMLSHIYTINTFYKWWSCSNLQTVKIISFFFHFYFVLFSYLFLSYLTFRIHMGNKFFICHHVARFNNWIRNFVCHEKSHCVKALRDT